MSQQQLKPYLVGYVSNHYEDIDDALVFAYNEAHAIQVVLETDQDAKFAYSSEPLIEEPVSWVNAAKLWSSVVTIPVKYVKLCP